MYCSKCGSQVPDGSAFCPKCGAAQAGQAAPVGPMPTPTPQPPFTGQPPAQQQAYQYQQAPSYQQVPAPGFQTPPSPRGDVMSTPLKPFAMPPSIGALFCGVNRGGVQYAEQSGLGMKWYKALASFLLYISAVFILYTGIQYFTGQTYGGSSGYVYSLYPALRFINVIYGLFNLVVAVAILYVRMHLAQFASDGPKLYLLMLLVNGIASAVFTIATFIIVGQSDWGSLATSIAGVIAMFVLNRTYFDKRQHLFTM